jgi:hypothetical protein
MQPETAPSSNPDHGQHRQQRGDACLPKRQLGSGDRSQRPAIALMGISAQSSMGVHHHLRAAGVIRCGSALRGARCAK